MDDDDDERAAWTEFRARLPEPLRDLTSEDGPDESPDVVVLDGREWGPADLLSVLREQVRLADLGGSLALRSEAAQLGYVAYAWREVVYRQVRAVIALSDAGLAVQAQPNARAALEHAVMLHAAATAEASGSGLDFLRAVAAEQNEHAVRALKRLRRWDKNTGGQYAPLVDAALQHDKTPTGPAPDLSASAGALFGSLGIGGEGFHDVYGQLSEGSHAGIVSARPYFLPGGPGGLGPQPVALALPLVALCWACWAADEALDVFMVTPGLAARHEPVTGFPLGEARPHPRSPAATDPTT